MVYEIILMTVMFALLATLLLCSDEGTLRSAYKNNVFSISTHDITVLVDSSVNFTIHQSDRIELPSTIKFISELDANLVRLEPSALQLQPNVSDYAITVVGVQPGHMDITAIIVPTTTFRLSDIFLRITVAKSYFVIYLSSIIGWIYFLAWSLSFYPQIYTNYKRRSVTGLNFDFLALNLVGFALYSAYNLSMFFSSDIRTEYMNRHPRGFIPVLLNDVIFSVHALFATMLTIGQCFFYDRGLQQVTLKAISFIITLGGAVVLLAALSVGSLVNWLDFLTYCSYFKLLITLVKYVPQAVMNYQRKSTVGWSIGNVCLDFTGGILSMLQMILNSFNYDDWISIFGDPTKFGLGLFSVCFDIFFMTQHYVLYRNTEPYMEIPEETVETGRNESDE